MGNKITTLQVKVKNILLQEWDPIGIKEFLRAQDEYDMYVPSISEMLVDKKSVDEIFQHLEWIEGDRMGLEINRMHTKKIAQKLFNLET